VPWDEELSEAQRRIASHPERIVRLVAGPGTGKTRVMTRRVAYLVEELGVNPASILALTFSRAAAQELRDRLEDLLGEEAGERPGVYTLHAFALRQLMRSGGASGFPDPVRIADDFDERWVIMEELARLTGVGVRDIENEITELASDWETLAAEEDEWEQRFPNGQFLAAWRSHRDVYGYTLRAELVYALKKLLDEDPDLQLEPSFTHVLVDEYQDLNQCEIAVVERLASGDRALFVAGDDDQSIYGFRNAFPLGLREFRDQYDGVFEEELEECHRCDSDILGIGLRVAEQDVDRIPKRLGPLPDAADGTVEALAYRDINHEAAGIADICKGLVDNEGIQPGSILIIFRNDPGAQIYSTPIVEALSEVGLEAELPANPLAILDQDQGRPLVCLLRLLRDRADGLAWREILKLRENRIGDATLLALYRWAAETRSTYHDALRVVAADPDAFDNVRRRRLSEEVIELEEWLDELQPLFDEPAEDVLPRILAEVDLPDDETEQLEALLLDLVGEVENPSLAALEEALHSVKGNWDQDERDKETNRIQLMTMHTAKGLTADAVIVAACEDELIPGWPDDQRELEDERRLLYVSLTRARHFLYVTFARERWGQQSRKLRSPTPNLSRRTYTRFLRDYLPPEAG
jgi:DNA helicase II / ATP-dependent DNA helicase PcrA